MTNTPYKKTLPPPSSNGATEAIKLHASRATIRVCQGDSELDLTPEEAVALSVKLSRWGHNPCNISGVGQIDPGLPARTSVSDEASGASGWCGNDQVSKDCSCDRCLFLYDPEGETVTGDASC